MTGVCSVYVTFADRDEAERIGRAMVEQGLAACVNILQPCLSIYRWQGAVETGEEVPALFKTSTEGADRLIREIRDLHSYDLPAIVAWPAIAATDGLDAWVKGDPDDAAS